MISLLAYPLTPAADRRSAPVQAGSRRSFWKFWSAYYFGLITNSFLRGQQQHTKRSCSSTKSRTMFRAAVRSSPRALRHSSLVVASSPTAGRRLASTAAAPADKKYTWKSTAARWGLAAGLLYWFNTSPIFADEAPRTSFLFHRKSAPFG